MGEERRSERLRCPVCLAVFRTEFDRCPADGHWLVAWDDDPLIGIDLDGRYVIEELVGQGSMGLVYRAHHVSLPRRFAIKILFGDLIADPRMRARFAQEATLASRLGHPNVVPVLDVGRTSGGLMYLVMDYVEGEELGQLIAREGPFEATRAIGIIRQLARGLGHAHSRGLVHRDFKPGNVLLERREDGPPVARILDFGLAISTRNRVQPADRITECGVIIGTPIYIAPEQVLDLEVDHRADLFALGVVLYEMLAGQPPFDGRPVEIAHKNVIQAVPPIAQRSPGVIVNPDLERIVHRLLAKSPHNRYASADDLCRALDELEQAAILARPRTQRPPRQATTIPLSREVHELHERVGPQATTPIPPSRAEDPAHKQARRRSLAITGAIAGAIAFAAAVATYAVASRAREPAKPRPAPGITDQAPRTDAGPKGTQSPSSEEDRDREMSGEMPAGRGGLRGAPGELPSGTRGGVRGAPGETPGTPGTPGGMAGAPPRETSTAVASR